MAEPCDHDHIKWIGKFQFLIGNVLAFEGEGPVIPYPEFQFLIGNVLARNGRRLDL